MSGIPLSVQDLPNGTVSVRLVRGDLANVVPNWPVELLVAGKTQVARTDETGRAEFSGVAPGTKARAAATLDGERLESEEFVLADTGGVRLLLASQGPAGASGGAAGSRPPAARAGATAGTVVLGGDSRIVIQFADDELEVFYLLDIMNAGLAPVKTEPLVFEMPPAAQGTSVLEGSSPQAVAEGRRVTIEGPFAPGRTVVQVAYSLTPGGDRARIAQRFPAALTQVTLIVQRAGALTMTSPVVRELREMSDQGRSFIMGTGPGLAAGATVTIDLAGLPHVARWPRNLALGLAALALVLGGWAAIRKDAPNAAAAARSRLEARREQLLGDLMRLDGSLRAGRVDAARHAARREGLLGELERIYGTLDRGEASGDDEARPRG